MYEFIVSGVNEVGRREYELVEAVDGDQAVDLLRRQGMSDLILHTDDFTCLTNKISPNLTYFTPEQIVKFLSASRGYVWWSLVKLGLRRFLLVDIVLAACVLAIWLINDELPAWLLAINAVVILAPVLVVTCTFVVGRTARMHQLQEAYGWGRWEEVLELASRIRTPQVQADLVIVQFTALLALGRTDEAEEVLSEIDKPSLMPRAAFWGNVAIARAQANDFRGAFDDLNRAFEFVPDNVALRWFQAAWCARVHDFDGARQAMARVAHREVPHAFWATRSALRGIFAMAERRYDEAVELLTEAKGLFAGYARANRSYRLAIALTQVRLALALAKTGDRDGARIEYAEARPVLDAYCLDDDIDRADRALDWS